MKNISKVSILLAVIAAGLLATSLALAGVGNITNTNHNFSLSGNAPQNKSTVINQVCVFCHTPHNAGQTRLLWNKANSSTAVNYRLYTSSSTLSNATRQSALTADSPSLLCLGCHDGKTAMNVLHNSGTGSAAAGYPAGSRYVEGSSPIPMAGPAYDFFNDTYGPSMNLGRAADGSNDEQGDNLTDDHPIGFSYSSVLSEPVAAARLFSIAEVATKSSNNIKFVGASNKVECTTCHDPHVDTSNQPGGNPALKPFLVMSNSGSALCLSCHNK